MLCAAPSSSTVDVDSAVFVLVFVLMLGPGLGLYDVQDIYNTQILIKYVVCFECGSHRSASVTTMSIVCRSVR